MNKLCYFDFMKIQLESQANEFITLSSFQNALYLETQVQLFTIYNSFECIKYYYLE